MFFHERGETFERNNDITRDVKRFLKRYRGWISRCVRSSRRTADSGGLERVRGTESMRADEVALGAVPSRPLGSNRPDEREAASRRPPRRVDQLFGMIQRKRPAAHHVPGVGERRGILCADVSVAATRQNSERSV
jgi:hypothetical protein